MECRGYVSRLSWNAEVMSLASLTMEKAAEQAAEQATGQAATSLASVTIEQAAEEAASNQLGKLLASLPLSACRGYRVLTLQRLIPPRSHHPCTTYFPHLLPLLTLFLSILLLPSTLYTACITKAKRKLHVWQSRYQPSS